MVLTLLIKIYYNNTLITVIYTYLFTINVNNTQFSFIVFILLIFI